MRTWNWLCFLVSLAALSFPESSFLSFSLFFPSFLPSFFPSLPSFPSFPSLSLVFFSFSFFCFFSLGGGLGLGGLPLQHALSVKLIAVILVVFNFAYKHFIRWRNDEPMYLEVRSRIRIARTICSCHTNKWKIPRSSREAGCEWLHRWWRKQCTQLPEASHRWNSK